MPRLCEALLRCPYVTERLKYSAEQTRRSELSARRTHPLLMRDLVAVDASASDN